MIHVHQSVFVHAHVRIIVSVMCCYLFSNRWLCFDYADYGICNHNTINSVFRLVGVSMVGASCTPQLNLSPMSDVVSHILATVGYLQTKY